MGEIELVIKIPEKVYNYVQQMGSVNMIDTQQVANAIFDAVPLPKGHGALKDTDAICKDIISALGIRDESYLLEAEKAIYERIKNASTIIQACEEQIDGNDD